MVAEHLTLHYCLESIFTSGLISLSSDLSWLTNCFIGIHEQSENNPWHWLIRRRRSPGLPDQPDGPVPVPADHLHHRDTDQPHRPGPAPGTNDQPHPAPWYDVLHSHSKPGEAYTLYTFDNYNQRSGPRDNAHAQFGNLYVRFSIPTIWEQIGLTKLKICLAEVSFIHWNCDWNRTCQGSNHHPSGN